MPSSPLSKLRASQTSRLVISSRRAIRTTPRRSMPQDMPPEGGYDPVQYKRNLPARGFRPMYYLFGIAAIMGYGWYKLFFGIREWNELAREKMWGRIHLTPLLQAEEDRDQVRRWYANQEREKDLLGSTGSVYHSDRFVRPTYSVSHPPEKE